MTVDDIGRQAGRALRARAATEPRPIRPSRSRPPVLIAGVIAVCVVLVAAAVVTGVRSSRGQSYSGFSSSGRAWLRYRAPWNDETGGPLVLGGVVAFRGKFVALTTDRPGSRTGPGIRHYRTTVWTSTDGRHWTAHRRVIGPGLNSSIATNGHRIVVATNTSNRHTPTYWSSDSETWHRGAVLHGDFETYVTSDGKDFAASKTYKANGYTVQVSTDGSHWGPPVDDTLVPAARWHGQQVAVDHQDQVTPVSVGLTRRFPQWHTYANVLPARTSRPVMADRTERRLVTIQYEPGLDLPGGRLWTSIDPRRPWTEIASFHAAFPAANPDHLAHTTFGLVVGGNEGANRRRATVWLSADLERWIEMPPSLRGPESGGESVLLAAHDDTALGTNARWTWLIRPSEALKAQTASVLVSGTMTIVGGPVRAGDGPVRSGSVTATRPDGRRFTVSVQNGRFTAELPQGDYTFVGRTPEWNNGRPCPTAGPVRIDPRQPGSKQATVVAVSCPRV